jgi:hypothetical protein
MDGGSGGLEGSLQTDVENVIGVTPDDMERYRHGERISMGFEASLADQAVMMCLGNKQPMP